MSFFLSDFLLYHYTDFCYYRSVLYYRKFKENRKKIRTNLEQYTLKTMKNLRTASLGANFIGSYKKKSVLRLFWMLDIFNWFHKKRLKAVWKTNIYILVMPKIHRIWWNWHSSLQDILLWWYWCKSCLVVSYILGTRAWNHDCPYAKLEQWEKSRNQYNNFFFHVLSD